MSDKEQFLIDRARALINTIDNPADLKTALIDLVEAEFPAKPRPAFEASQSLPLAIFLERFKQAVCHGVEPTFAQHPVKVVDLCGALYLDLGVPAKGLVE